MPQGIRQRKPFGTGQMINPFLILAHDRAKLGVCGFKWKALSDEPGDPHSHRCSRFKGHKGGRSEHTCGCGKRRGMKGKHSRLGGLRVRTQS
jgi:hypothetical protein